MWNVVHGYVLYNNMLIENEPRRYIILQPNTQMWKVAKNWNSSKHWQIMKTSATECYEQISNVGKLANKYMSK